MIRYGNGALGTVTASQISHGRENDLWIEVDGTKGALEWHQEEPNKLLVRINGKPPRVKASPDLGEHTAQVLSSWLGLSADEVGRLKANKIV